MKVVILAGGIGSRISEESVVRPKPLIEIGGMPIIWHIMKIYSSYGFKDFVICCGYKGYLIKEFFSNYFLHSSDLTIDLENDKIIYHQKRKEPWKITLVDTGDNTSTGGRIKPALPWSGFLFFNIFFCTTRGKPPNGSPSLPSKNSTTDSGKEYSR